MSPVIVHLPRGFARTLRANDAAGINHLGYRVWDALLANLCDPTCRAVAARFNVNKDTAARALRSLLNTGLLWRGRRSAGRGVFAWCYVVTDAPFAWLDDASLADKIDRAHAHEVERLRAYHEPDDLLTPVPEPEPQQEPNPVPHDSGYPQESPLVSCPNETDVSIKDSSQEISTPTPSPVDRVIHSPRRFTDRRLATVHRLLTHLHADHELQPHVPDALALLHGLGFPPISRLRHAVIVARALRSGRSLHALTSFLTSGMSTARNPKAVIVHRLGRLRETLDRERLATPTDQSV